MVRVSKLETSKNFKGKEKVQQKQISLLLIMHRKKLSMAVWINTANKIFPHTSFITFVFAILFPNHASSQTLPSLLNKYSPSSFTLQMQKFAPHSFENLVVSLNTSKTAWYLIWKS